MLSSDGSLPPSSTPISQVESPQKRRLRALPVVIGKEDRQRLERSGSVGSNKNTRLPVH
jgi:hypothetical protein